MKNKFRPLIISCLSLLSLSLKFLIPPNLQLDSAHDDLLFAKLGLSIRNGNWLGDWDQNTLLKEPLYPIISSLGSLTNISPQLIIHFLYICISLLVFYQFKGTSFRYLIFVYIMLIFNPFLFSYFGLRHYREILISSLVLLVLINSAKIILYKQHVQFRSIFVSSFAMGLLLITKFDIVFWCFPIFIISVFILFSRHKKKFNFHIVLFITKISILVMLFIIPGFIVSSLNYSKYGVFTITDQNQLKFPQLLNLLKSIQTNVPNPKYVQVSVEQRNLAYQESKKFAELYTILETPPNTGWKIQSCNELGICDESAGWFTNELRDAVFLNSDRTPLGFQNDLSQMVLELNDACRLEKFTCRSTVPDSLKFTNIFVQNLNFIFDALSFGNFDSRKITYYNYDLEEMKKNQNLSIFEQFSYNLPFYQNLNFFNKFLFFVNFFYPFAYLIFLLVFFTSFRTKIFFSVLYKSLIILSPFLLHALLISYLEINYGGYKFAYLQYLSESYPSFILFLFSLLHHNPKVNNEE